MVKGEKGTAPYTAALGTKMCLKYMQIQHQCFHISIRLSHTSTGVQTAASCPNKSPSAGIMSNGQNHFGFHKSTH